MIYREIEFRVIQGIGRHLWKWSVSLDAYHSVTGQAATKPEAVAEAASASSIAAFRPQTSFACCVAVRSGLEKSFSGNIII
jgi:hypothetical protein